MNLVTVASNPFSKFKQVSWARRKFEYNTFPSRRKTDDHSLQRCRKYDEVTSLNRQDCSSQNLWGIKSKIRQLCKMTKKFRMYSTFHHCNPKQSYSTSDFVKFCRRILGSNVVVTQPSMVEAFPEKKLEIKFMKNSKYSCIKEKWDSVEGDSSKGLETNPVNNSKSSPLKEEGKDV